MKIIFLIVLVVATTACAYRARENFNVLVPNNDVNVHANIKKLLADDDFDPQEVREFIKIDRLLKPLIDVKFEIEKAAPPPSPRSKIVGDDDISSSGSSSDDSDVLLQRTRKRTTSTTLPFLEDAREYPGSNVTYPNATWPTTTPFPSEPWNFSTSNIYNVSTPSWDYTTPSMNQTTTHIETTSTWNFNLSLPATTPNINSTTTSFYWNLSTPGVSSYTTPTWDFNSTTPHTPADLNISSSTPPYASTPMTPNNTTPGLNFSTTPPLTPPELLDTTHFHNFTDSSTPQHPSTVVHYTSTKATPADENSTANEECLLGKVSETLKWVDEYGALQMGYIREHQEMSNLKAADFSRHEFSSPYAIERDVQVLSLAYNNFDRLPNVLLNEPMHSLQYLSLAGNQFRVLGIGDTLVLPNLKQLDLRKCSISDFKPDLFRNLPALVYLYLSDNNINNLMDEDLNLPSLEHLDLSSNREDALIQSGLKIKSNVFSHMRNLKFLDLSHTKLDTKAVEALEHLPTSLIGVSLCYTELSTSDNFLANLSNLKYLDLSGNTQLNLTKNFFSNISYSLERLEAKDANVRNLEWTHPLIKLKVLNLKDNKLKLIDNNSFSHMLVLEDLNLSKNSIVNWYTRLFGQNQELETLDLRENALTFISDEMREDLLSVRHLAIGKNAFECNCLLYEFFHKLFDATKNANIQQIEEGLKIPSSQQSTLPTLQLGARNNLRPEYDIMSRTYQKYYEQILRSIEALKKNNYSTKSKALLSVSDVESTELKPPQTVLLDYDENNEDYQCMNKTQKALQSMLDLIELCANEARDPSYDSLIIALSAAIPSVLLLSVLIVVIIWRWYDIRYFFVICKNAAILSFMDGGDDREEVIVRRKSTSSSIDIYLYDVFVSYSDQNRSWVLDEFIPNIERRESINVCLHERDFQVGYGILENIVSCMDRSRCLLLLVSEQFLESQWCQFEMNLAQHRLLETRKEKLILVLLEDIPARKQSKTLKYLMRTKTYIKWPNNGTHEEKQLFWKRLKKSIISSKWECENYGSTA